VQPTHHPPEHTAPAAHWLLALQEQPLACVQVQPVGSCSFEPVHFSQTLYETHVDPLQ
jgi:hypothetical protein